MSRPVTTASTTRLHYNPQKKSHNPKRGVEQSRWRAAPVKKAAATRRCTSREKAFFLDLIQPREVVPFVFCQSPFDQHSYDGTVPPLSHLCLRAVTDTEKSFRAQLARLTGDYLPTEIRNSLASTALARGYLTSEREMRRLLLHADLEELAFSHANCRELVNDAFLRQFFPHAPIIKEVDSWEEITTADMYRSPQGCPRLVRLSLATCWNISAHLIRDALKSFAHLSVLDLSDTPVDLLRGIHFESPSLTQLVLARIRGTRLSSPLCFTLAAPSLSFLSLRDTHYVGRIRCVGNSGSFPRDHGGSGGGGLTAPSSSGGIVFASGASAVPLPLGLHALDMSGVRLSVMIGSEASAEESLLHLCCHNAGTLKVLNLACCDVKPRLLTRIRSLALSEQSLHEPSSLPDLRLEEVSLANNKNLSSDAIVALVRTFSSSLQLLDIARCDVDARRITDATRTGRPAPALVRT